jgi:sulfate adenylyltransferase
MTHQAAPQHCPTPRELDDLELLTTGAAAPVTAFNEPGSPITLELPADLAAQVDAGGRVELVDPEGLPLAVVTGDLDRWRVEALTHAQYGPFRDHYLTPAQTRERYAGRTFVPVTDALTDAQLLQLRELGPVVLLALVGTGTPALSAVGLLRATLRGSAGLAAEVVAVPLASHDDAERDAELRSRVVATYAGDDAVVTLSPGGAVLPQLVDIVAEDRPAPEDRGLVLFFTGLSGSGKSTLARALMDRLLEHGGRTLTSLDGDVVRRNLSAGLTFSKEDRETNIRRIGWVAAEIARHGGVAVCSPIAPFDATRQQVRQYVADAGGAFFLVHVATPLEECERRDRKGLYAKARRGEIPEFTGISSPYEEPADADVRVDTTGRSIEDALDDVLVALREAGYLDLTGPALGAGGSAAAEPPATPLKVLYVCTANICRSPYLELRSRQLQASEPSISDALVFSSTGTHGFADREIDPPMADVLLERGARAADLGAFRSRRLSPAQIEEADVVLTADADHRDFVLEEMPAAFPKVFTLGQFAATIGRLDPGVHGRELVAAANKSRVAATSESDIADPFQRGAEAAAASAAQIEDLLRVVLPRLSGPAADGDA